MFSRENPALSPTAEEMGNFIQNPLWEDFCGYMEREYGSEPAFSFSKCGMEYGWNAKFKKGSRALCTVYPREGYFTAMLVIGRKEKPQAEEQLPTFCDDIQELYRKTSEGNGQKWLMIDLEDRDRRYDDLKALLRIRCKK